MAKREHPHERMAQARRRARMSRWLTVTVLVVFLAFVSVGGALLVGA